ncbi:MAG: LmbE family N-acetylglucosaminyl deacetylase [Verrucomicrobiales bacterium]|jgi:LmbE family N-acetylglucosaminyl deacetylase
MKPIHFLSLCCLLLSACTEKEAVPRAILIVAPHPDDETLGCGGQIALLTKEGYTVHVLVLTDGSQLFVSRFGSDSQPPPAEISSRRKRETERTVAHLGGDPADIRYLDFADGNLSLRIDDAASIVAETIKDLDPDRVYVTSRFEGHPDHRAANVITKRAFAHLVNAKPDLWEYCVGPRPEFGVGDGPEKLMEIDITSVLDRKTEAVGMFACHLEITVEGQTESLWKDGSNYLADTERFLMTPGAQVVD